MERILVATDFSTRSDRALRRATLLAREIGASMTLIHVVDADRPDYLVSQDRAAAEKTLAELAKTVRDIDAVACDYRIVLGDPFDGIVGTARSLGSDLLVIGPHRRQILRDAFVGTTAERVIRHCPVPVLMANGSPRGAYGRVLVASDRSLQSAAALDALRRLDVAGAADVTLFEALDIPEVALMIQASTPSHEINHHIQKREAAATEELRAFAADLPFSPHRCLARIAEGTTATAILQATSGMEADLIVIGTRGRSGLVRFLLGSVAEAVLRSATVDVLVVPPGDPAGED